MNKKQTYNRKKFELWQKRFRKKIIAMMGEADGTVLLNDIPEAELIWAMVDGFTPQGYIDQLLS